MKAAKITAKDGNSITVTTAIEVSGKEILVIGGTRPVLVENDLKEHDSDGEPEPPMTVAD